MSSLRRRAEWLPALLVGVACATAAEIAIGVVAATVEIAVIAVIAVIAWPPSMVTALISAWIPAPPPESSRTPLASSVSFRSRAARTVVPAWRMCIPESRVASTLNRLRERPASKKRYSSNTAGGLPPALATRLASSTETRPALSGASTPPALPPTTAASKRRARS